MQRRPVMVLTIVFVMILSSICPVLSVSADTVRSYPIDDAERFGVNTGWGAVADYDMDQLGVSWYTTWNVETDPLRPGEAEFVQVIRLRDDANPAWDLWPPDWAAIEDAIDANPGSLWLIGNEPDHVGQDNLLPETYAVVYKECYDFIKDKDPTALVSAGGVVQTTPIRLMWLDRVLTEYASLYGEPMPVDVWNVHEQILTEHGFPPPDEPTPTDSGYGAGYPPGLPPEPWDDLTPAEFAYWYFLGRDYTYTDSVSVPKFEALVNEFRVWMEANGYRDTPLIISEYGVLQPSGCGYIGFNYDIAQLMVTDFMTETFDFMLQTTDATTGYPEDGNRLVQRWAWYSLSAPMSEPAYTQAECEDPDWYKNAANGSLFVNKDPSYWYWDTHPWQDEPILTEFGENYRDYVAENTPIVVSLKAGWNLYSTPVRPSDTSVPQVLDSIQGKYDAVYCYGLPSQDPPLFYDPDGPPAENTLDLIDQHRAIWIHMIQDGELFVSGIHHVAYRYALSAGWQQVPYPSRYAYPVEQALASIDGKYDLVLGYDPAETSSPWMLYAPGLPSYVNGFTSFEPGNSYWVHMTEAGTWDVN